MGVDQYPISNIQHLHTSTVLVRRVQIYSIQHLLFVQRSGAEIRDIFWYEMPLDSSVTAAWLSTSPGSWLLGLGNPAVTARSKLHHTQLQATARNPAFPFIFGSNGSKLWKWLPTTWSVSKVYACLRMSAVNRELYLIESSYNIKAQAALNRKSRRRASYADYSLVNWGWPVFWSRPCSSPNYIPKSICEIETKKPLSYRTASVLLGIPIGGRAGLQSTLIFEMFMTRVLSHSRGTF